MKTPALLIGFNRPELFRQVIDSVREIRPEVVYVSIDGPRDERDRPAVDSTLDQVEAIDWPCRLAVRASDNNLGCREGVASAITWLFENEERGIILEDDIVPTPAFFDFVERMLDRYEHDERIATVTGFNRVPRSRQGTRYDLRFSRYAHIWGWATWRRTWKEYRSDISGWETTLPLAALRSRVDGSLLEALHWRRIFNDVATGGLDTWDAQLEYLVLHKRQLTIAPSYSLVKNIGFGPDATHTHRRPAFLEEPRAVNLTDLPDLPVEQDLISDAWESRNVLHAAPMPMLTHAVRRLLGGSE